MNEVLETEVVVVGAGPAGSTCAAHLAKSGIRCILIDKAVFPRDKVCGDVLGGDVVDELTLLGEDVPSMFAAFTNKSPYSEVKFTTPSYSTLHLNIKKRFPGFDAPSYVAERLLFDNFVFELAKREKNVRVLQGVFIQEAIVSNEGIVLRSKDGKLTVKAKMAIGTDGANSAIAKLTGRKINRKYLSAGLRQYWENVDGIDLSKPIELHFYKELIPGYFWVFPLPGNKANIGMGMRSDIVSKKKINIKQVMHKAITEHPNLAHRFKNARPLEDPVGFTLPYGTTWVQMYGDRFILAGDAAHLIDPFTGEGVGNAMISGRIAAEHTMKAIKENRFDASFHAQYEKNIKQKMGNEMGVSRNLQKMLGYPWIFNFLVKKANKNKHLVALIEGMMNDPDSRKLLTKPSFYFKLLLNTKS